MDSGAEDRHRRSIPEWTRRWQATLFDHGWMIPGYPPELGGRNATPIQTLVYLEEMARRRIPRSLHFPGYAIVAPSLLEFGNDEQRALVARRHPRRHDLVHRDERAQRRLGPGRTVDPRRARRRPLRRERPEGLDQLRDASPRSASCYVRTDPTCTQAQGHQPADRRHGHTRHRDPTAAPPERRGQLRRGVLHRRAGPGGEPGRGPQRRLAHHPGLPRPRAGRPVGRGRVAPRGNRAGPRRPGRTAAASTHDTGVRRRIAELYEQAASLRAAGLQGVRQLRAGLLGAGALVHEDGDVRARQGRLRARHGAPGRRRPRPATRSGARRAAAGSTCSS